jgi:transaldolase
VSNKREQLARWTEIVADTGEIDAIEQLRPMDATTNPSLLLSVARSPEGEARLRDAHKFAAQLGRGNDIGLLCDAFATLTGQHILSLVPGLVSTEVDARLSFDYGATLARARRIVALYRELGIERERVLIKIASTWEGIRAAEVLEEEGIACNLTLLFSETQALAAAQAGATLVSPFVGRIYDWYCKRGDTISSAEQDPGVQSVRNIYRLYRSQGYDTIVMGASFRYPQQIEALAGCDKLTISPALLAQLEQDDTPLQRALDPADIVADTESDTVTEQAFRWALNDDAMASDLLSDGIRRFAHDQEALETLLKSV